MSSRHLRGLMAALLLLAAPVPAQSQLLNAGFENWTDCIPDHWGTPNACGVLTPVTRSSNAASGSWAARGEVINFFGQSVAPAVQSGADGTGVPISQRYDFVKGMYLFSPAGGDKLGVNVAFYRGGNVIAQGAIAITTAAASYTEFNVPMNYTSADIPDTAIVQILIFGPGSGADVHVGSTMHVDALTLGVNSTAEPRLSISRNGNSITVSWPVDVTGYRLQSTADLNSPNWAEVSGVSAGNTYVFIPVSQEYFRLIKP